jgi:hypothetical protein
MPPAFIAQENRTWTIRSTLSGAPATAFIFTAFQLAAHLGVIATSATTSSLLCDQFRLTRVCVWGPVATAGTPVSVLLKFVDDPASNTQAGPPKTEVGTSSNINEYAYACLTPPKNNSSIFSQWCDASLTTQWIVVSAPVGSIIQFWFNFILDDLGATSAGPTIAGATLGQIYHKNAVAGGATWTVTGGLNSI